MCRVSARILSIHKIYKMFSIKFVELMQKRLPVQYKKPLKYTFLPLVYIFCLIGTLKKNTTFFVTKSTEIIISYRRAGFTLQKRSFLYKTKKRKKKKHFFIFFLILLMMLDFATQGYDIQIKTNKFCMARMYSCMCGVFIFKKIHKQKSE
jgi:hypothetical protein